MSHNIHKNEKGTYQHSYRAYSPDYFEKLWKNASTEDEKERVRNTLAYMEDGRFLQMLEDLHEFVGEMDPETTKQFSDSNPRMKTWLDIYRKIEDPDMIDRSIDDFRHISTDGVRRTLDKQGKKEARKKIRHVGTGVALGSFSEFLNSVHRMVSALDGDEIESFFQSNPRMKTWINLYAEAEELRKFD